MHTLPFIEQSAVDAKFDLTKKWDNAANATAVSAVISTFLCPTAPTPNRGNVADYSCARCFGSNLAGTLNISGNEYAPDSMGMLVRDKFTRVKEVTDGLSNTIMVVEDGGRPTLFQNGQPVPGSVANNPRWAEWDLKITINSICGSNAQMFNCTNDNEIYSLHMGGSHFVMGDGSCHFIRQIINMATFKALITRANDDVTTENWLQ